MRGSRIRTDHSAYSVLTKLILLIKTLAHLKRYINFLVKKYSSKCKTVHLKQIVKA